MPDVVGVSPLAARGQDPRTPLGHLARLDLVLADAADVDAVTRSVVSHLVSLPGVRRVGIGLSEGGGRRLRFTASDRPLVGELEWCHIDAYDDVPLTTVVRTGDPILSTLDDLDAKFADIAVKQRSESIEALAALPLPGADAPVGGLLLFFDVPQRFDGVQRRLLEATARRTAEALRRLRRVPGPSPEFEVGDQDGAHQAGLMIDSDPRSAGHARRFLRHELAAWDVDDDSSDTAQLCVSELVTNVIMHAGSPSELRVSLLDGVLTVVLRDYGGPGREQRSAEPDTDSDPFRVHGRGLRLVESLVDRWGSERDATGTTVWFALELDEDPAGQQTG